MMPYEQFVKLKRGDVVLYNGTPRVVQDGPSDDSRPRHPRSRKGSVQFVKMRNSQCLENPTTCYLWNDIKHHLFAEPVHMSSRRVFHHEKERLKVLGPPPATPAKPKKQ